MIIFDDQAEEGVCLLFGKEELDEAGVEVEEKST